MSGYKRVNYYELCRLCTSTEGSKIHIFRDEGRRRQLPTKIKRCLPLKVFDYDLLPKMICQNCVTKLDEIDNFRQLCLEAEKMLHDFRATLRSTVGDGEGKLQVYVKESQSQMLETKISLPSEPLVPSDNTHDVPNSKCVVEKGAVSVVNVPNRVVEETHQMPLQCSIPLKLNGATASVVPINVENISSLMQVIPDDEIPRIQQFKLPIQTELALVDEPSNSRFSVTLPTVDVVSKENAVIRSLRCAVNDDGSINVHKVDLQSTAATSSVSFNNSVAVSLIPPPATNMVSNGNIQEVISCVEIPKEEQPVKSCTHCGKILTGPNEVCNHTVVRPAASPVSETTSVITTSDVEVKPLDNGGQRQFSELNGFNCEVCEKAFRKREHLLQHRKLHTGDRPYICTSCGKSFSRKEHLFRHMLAHTGEKRHTCDFCGKTFSRKDNLHKHRKIHGFNGPYECELCGKSFIVQHYYLMHRANHGNTEMEELPFQCDICKKGFVKEEFLNRHKIRHRIRNLPQHEEPDLVNLNPVTILSPAIVQQNLCSIEEAVYVTTQPITYSVTPSVVSNTTAATQTLFSHDLLSNSQLLGNYKQSNTTIVS